MMQLLCYTGSRKGGAGNMAILQNPVTPFLLMFVIWGIIMVMRAILGRK